MVSSNTQRKPLQDQLITRDILPFIGIYDVFSASIAARHFDGLFVSGFSFAASYYGLPDLGFNTWSDIVAFVQRLKMVLPDQYIIVDIDDGFGDAEVAAHVVSLLNTIGVDGVVLEDQQRPRRCGHFEGKNIMRLDDYLVKLKKVIDAKGDIFVVARTDAGETDEIVKRCRAFADAGADAVLADGIMDLEILRLLNHEVTCPIVFNQIAGGKSPACTLTDLSRSGVSVVLYSTPALFAAQEAVEKAARNLKSSDGLLPVKNSDSVDLNGCTALLTENVSRRVGK